MSGAVSGSSRRANRGRAARGAGARPLGATALRAAALLALLAFALYVSTAYRTVAGGDSGELAGAVGSGGVIHPPGYPAYALLGRVFALLPFGSLAFRLHLLSAACDAAAAGVLLLAAARLTGSIGAGVLAGGLFAVAPGVWRYAICAEVFPLNNLCVSFLTLAAVSYEKTRARRWAFAGAFAVGLGLANHHTVLFVAAPLALWVLWRGRADLGRAKVLLGLCLAITSGLLAYLYLPLAARRHAVVTWGAADTWAGFFTHVLRREYGTFQLAPAGVAGKGATGWETVQAFASDVLEGLGPAGFILALVGAVSVAVRARRRSFQEGLFAVACIALPVGVMAALGNLPVADALHRGIVARFWQEPEIFVFFLCGIAFTTIARAAGPAGARAEAPLAATIVLVAATVRYRDMDRSGSTLVRAYGAEILRAAPPDALLLTKGDLITNTVRYLQLAEGMRRDVRVVDQELLGLPWDRALIHERYPDVAIPGAVYSPGAPGGFDLKALVDANIARAPVLICGGIKAGDASSDATYGRWPFGLCERVRPGTEGVNLDAWVAESEAALPRVDFRGQPRPEGSWEAIVWGDYWEVRQDRAAHLLAVAGRDESRHKYIVLAAQILEGIVKENPDVPAHIYRNLAVALGRSGLDSAEQRAKAARAWQGYLDRSPRDDPQRPTIEKELARLRATAGP